MESTRCIIYELHHLQENLIQWSYMRCMDESYMKCAGIWTYVYYLQND